MKCEVRSRRRVRVGKSHRSCRRVRSITPRARVRRHYSHGMGGMGRDCVVWVVRGFCVYGTNVLKLYLTIQSSQPLQIFAHNLRYLRLKTCFHPHAFTCMLIIQPHFPPLHRTALHCTSFDPIQFNSQLNPFQIPSSSVHPFDLPIMSSTLR